MSDFDRLQRELVPGALRGYRQWRSGGGSLFACNFGYEWVAGRNEALHLDASPFITLRDECRAECDAPRKGCSCGFYAHHNPRNRTGDYMGVTDVGGLCAGSIKAYGKVILGDIGFKAQYAEIESLVVPVRLVPAYQKRYPQAKIFRNFTDLVEEFPPIPVDELLGPKPEPVIKTTQLTEEQVAAFLAALKGPLWGPKPKQDIDKESSE